MTTDGEYTAVVDRFEEDQAVLLLEADGETVDEIVVGATALPEDGRHANAVLDVEVVDGELVAVTYREEETETRSEKAQRRFDELSQRPPDSDDEDDPGS